MVVSCKSGVQNKSASHLQFSWSISGKIPGDSSGKPLSGLAGPVVGINNDILVIGGGANFPRGMPWDGGKKEYHSKIYAFRKAQDSLINIQQNIHLPYKLAYSANCSSDKGIVVAGGENGHGPLKTVLLLGWDKTRQQVVISHLPDLPQALTDGAIAVDNDIIYFAGGIGTDSVSNHFYALSLKDTAAGWQILPSLPEPVSHTVLYVQSNGEDTCAYLVGGRKEIRDSVSNLYNEVYQFDLKTKHWSQKTSLPYPLSAQTGVSWGDSSLLVFSGDEGRTFHETEALLMKISREKNQMKKKLLIEEKNNLQKNHPGYNGNVLLYNTHADEWTKTDSIPFPGQVTTTAIKWNNEIIIPCGEIRAGVRTPDIIAGKLVDK